MREVSTATIDTEPRADGATDKPDLATTATALHAIGDPIRLGILMFLARSGPSPVKTIQQEFGQRQTTTSYHLRLLHLVGVVAGERTGQENRYHIVPGRIREILSQLDPLLTE